MIRQSADRARGKLDGANRLPSLRKAIAELKERRAKISDADLTRAVSHAEGVRSVSVATHGGGLIVDASFDRREVNLRIGIGRVSFAPRGAKEIHFHIAPEQSAHDRETRVIVGALASVFANTLWGVALANEEIAGAPIVERAGTGLRVDLRTVPRVRAALARGGTSLIIDALMLNEIEVEQGCFQRA